MNLAKFGFIFLLGFGLAAQGATVKPKTRPVATRKVAKKPVGRKVRLTPEMISFADFKKLSFEKKKFYLRGLRKLMYQASRFSKKKRKGALFADLPRAGVAPFQDQIWSLLLTPSYAEDPPKGYRYTLPDGRTILPPNVPLPTWSEQSVPGRPDQKMMVPFYDPKYFTPSGALLAPYAPFSAVAPAAPPSAPEAPAAVAPASPDGPATYSPVSPAPENPVATSDAAPGPEVAAPDVAALNTDRFEHLRETTHPDKCGTYTPECSGRDEKRADFYATGMDVCIFAGSFSHYKGGVPAPGGCEKPVWGDFRCESSSDVVCNPLVFGGKPGGGFYCVPASPDATESCYKDTQSEASMDFLKGLSDDQLNQFRGSWDELKAGFDKVCAGSGDQSAFGFFCYECKAIFQRLIELNVVVVGSDDCTIPEWEAYKSRVKGAAPAAAAPAAEAPAAP